MAGSLATFALLLPQPSAEAAATDELYVTPSGSGTTCSSAAPCSMTQAQTKVRGLRDTVSGDILVHVGHGTYSLTQPLVFGPDDSGRDAVHRVIWQATSGAEPVFTGAAAVTGWTTADTVNGNQIWKAAAPAGITDTRQMYVDGKRATRSRSDYLPNYTYKDLGNDSAAFTTPSTGSSIFTWTEPSAVEAVFHSTFLDSRCPLDSVSRNTATGRDEAKVADPCWGEVEYAGNFAQHALKINYLENAYELLDMPGEWYFDKSGVVAGGQAGTFYYIPKAGQSMTGAGAPAVTVPRLQTLLTVAGTQVGSTVTRVHDLVFDGLTFADTTWSLPGITNNVGAIDDDDVAVQYTGSWTAQSGVSGQFQRTQHVTSTNGDSFTASFSGTGVRFLSQQNTNRGSFTYRVDGQAIQSGTCYYTELVDQDACVEVSGLTAGSHTIEVTKTGGSTLSLDMLRVINPSGEATTPGYIVSQGDVIATGKTQKCELADQVTTPSAITISMANGIAFTGNNITRVGQSALTVDRSSYDIQIVGNKVSDVSATGIRIGGVSRQDMRPANTADRMHDIVVSNNYVHDVGVEFRSAVAIIAGYVDTLEISHNELADLPYSGISVGWGWGFTDQDGGTFGNGTNCPTKAELQSYDTGPTVARNTTIRANYVHDYMRVGMDGGGFYSLGSQPNSLVEGNYFARTGSFGGHQRGVYLDNGTHGYTVRNNVAADLPSPWLFNYADGMAASSGNVDGGGNTTSTSGEAAEAIIAGAGLEAGYGGLNPLSDSANRLLGSTASATSGTGGAAVDGSMMSRWQTASGNTDATLTVTLPQLTPLNRIKVYESLYLTDGNSYGRINSYSLDYQNAAGDWTALAAGSQPANVETVTFSPIQARAIRMRVLTSGSAGIDMIQGFYDNLALGRPTTQSSTSYGGYSSRAVDGNTSGDWLDNSITQTDAQTNAWWRVDLGESQTLTSVNLWNRADMVPERLSNYWVFVSTAPFNTSLTPAQQAAQSGVWSQHLTTQAGRPTKVATPTAGRYVMVQLDGSGYLSLAELQVLGAPTSKPNVALGTTATQSSSYSGSTGASLAVDGLTDGNFAAGSVTHTNNDVNAWWRTDLGAAKDIASVEVWNRTDMASDRLSDYWVFVSSTPFNTTLAPALQAAQSGVWSQHLTIQAGSPTHVPVGVSGRYVMIQLNGTGYLSLAEVQVFAVANLALGTPAAQSSSYSGSTGASLAVDGVTDGNFAAGSVTHTNNDVNAWWRTDLGAAKDIASVEVWNRTEMASDRLSDYWVFVSSTPFNTLLTPAQQAAQSGVWSQHLTTQAGSPTHVPLGVSGRYVMVQLNGTGYLSLAEVQVLD